MNEIVNGLACCLDVDVLLLFPCLAAADASVGDILQSQSDESL